MKGSAFFLSFLILSTTAFAFDQPLELKGIKTINAAVADLSDNLLKAGVEKEDLSKTLELALRDAGLTVFTEGQYSGTVPTISLRVSAIQQPDGRLYATDIELACFDNVYNNRTAGPFTAIIWSKDVLQLLGKVDLSRLVDAEKKLIDMFLTDYLQANSR